LARTTSFSPCRELQLYRLPQWVSTLLFETMPPERLKILLSKRLLSIISLLNLDIFSTVFIRPVGRLAFQQLSNLRDRLITPERNEGMDVIHVPIDTIEKGFFLLRVFPDVVKDLSRKFFPQD
jgi:hypothetical protein